MLYFRRGELYESAFVFAADAAAAAPGALLVWRRWVAAPPAAPPETGALGALASWCEGDLVEAAGLSLRDFQETLDHRRMLKGSEPFGFTPERR